MDDREIEARKQRAERYYKQPFVPDPKIGKAEDRAATALEYIAAQLHIINAKLETIVLQGRNS